MVAGDVDHHQVFAKAAQPVVAEPAAGRKIGQEYAPVLALRGDQAGRQIRALGARQGLKVGCHEEAALNMGFSDADQLDRLIAKMPDSQYSQYLRKVGQEAG